MVFWKLVNIVENFDSLEIWEDFGFYFGFLSCKESFCKKEIDLIFLMKDIGLLEENMECVDING